MILLDTCALLWLDSDRDLLSTESLKHLEHYANAIAVSPISFMEIGIKAGKGRIVLPMSLEKWTDKICDKYSLTVLPITRNIAVKASTLPEIHRDPFDRIIIATAALNRLKIVTADKVFAEYGEIKVIW